MRSLISHLSPQWDLWIGQFRAFFPTEEVDRMACAKVMGEENTSDKHSIPDGDSFLAACQDTHSGEIIACMNLVDALQVKKKLGSDEKTYLHHFDDDRLSTMAFFTSISISPNYLKTPAPQVLISHCFIEFLKVGGQAILMSCNPGHFSMYKRIGMRPVGALQKSDQGGFEIPMIFLPDQDYLSIIHSPVLPLLRGMYFDKYTPICQWYYQLVRENSELSVGSSFYATEQEFGGHDTITEGLSEEGKAKIRKSALVLNCEEGEVLIAENDGGKSLGYVRKGIVKVMIGDKTVVLLGEGDIFGEIAFVLNIKRTAQVVAASDDTEVVLFSESAFNNLPKEGDKAILWNNLAKILAQRVVLTNKLLDKK